MTDAIRACPRATNARVLVVDDHGPLRRAWCDFIDSLPGFEVVGDCEYGRDALQMAEALRPDLMYLDVRMQERDGLATVPFITHHLPASRVVVHSGKTDWTAVLDALSDGVSAFLYRDDVPYCIESALQSALSGRVFISPSIYPDRRR